ncbi:hybrid sensor histidine kinase/response regulator [Aliishimia ponticola]|uniref:histidine kinase n=1 Tax=Aliishimia ponticola TaxID=2499833 RepID=A0A4S4NHY0_9RHOB|nr:hybrid sensor histidine kinase/response regulator [Aliishimia ponticola]THH38485.1 hybrid sensor histidine kinase/response regulator [Aliishimia ponticola]
MGDISLLLVDDNPEDREFVTRALKRSGHSYHPVTEALDSTECLTWLSDGLNPDCILLDYSLPGRDGLATLEKIVAMFPDTPVVMITGQGDEAIAVKAMQMGAQDYIPKSSMTHTALDRSITNAIERSGMTKMIREQRQSLEAFSRMLVHDLRAPLRSITGAIEFLFEDLPDPVVQEHKEMLDFVNHGAQRMDQLIVALQAYNSLDDSAPEATRVDLNAQMEAVAQNLSMDLKTANAELGIAPDLPEIQGDAPLIVQLFQNLVSNGLKYNRSDTPQVQVSARKTNAAIQILVQDNGIGISQEDAAQVFEPFLRLHSEREFEGTGLGLATCKRIMELHNGRIYCRPGNDVGTVFVCEFPART